MSKRAVDLTQLKRVRSIWFEATRTIDGHRTALRISRERHLYILHPEIFKALHINPLAQSRKQTKTVCRPLSQRLMLSIA